MADKKMELAMDIQQAAETQGFTATLTLIKENVKSLETSSQAIGVREILKKATKDRLLLSFLNSVEFGKRKLTDSLARLDGLLSFTPGALVISKTWGIGKVVRVDPLYRRITVDFKGRNGHQLSYEAACDTLRLAPEDHILVKTFTPAGETEVAEMVKNQQDDFVRLMLKSFGNMPVARLEELCEKLGFVKKDGKDGWKKFWEEARKKLKEVKAGVAEVVIPARRTEPILLKETGVKFYSESWFAEFGKEKDPKAIFDIAKELELAVRKSEEDRNRAAKATQAAAEEAAKKGLPPPVAGKLPEQIEISESSRQILAGRLDFALKGVRGVDNALYARIAFCIAEQKLDPGADSEFAASRSYMWERDRYLTLSRDLPARDVGNLVRFLVGAPLGSSKSRLTEEDRQKLYAALPQMCFNMLVETIRFFSNDPACEQAVADLLKTPHPPATLVTCVLGHYDSFAGWKSLPPFVAIVQHAIALGEGRQTGEVLKMQNMVRRLFANKEWLETTMKALNVGEKVQVFERFQASTSWDPATHRTITTRMLKCDEENLKPHVVKPAEKVVRERLTSQRSYNEKRAAYDRLVNVDMPANTKRIEFARGYGDLSENAEYQYAKDEQRALLQKQSLMQADLDAVKPSLFEGVAADEVRMGTMVTVATGDGVEKTYVVLGEWDNDPALNIISSGTKLAANLLGRKPGEDVSLADADGNAVAAKVLRIEPLSETVKDWIRS